ncbi:alpha/beta hydrolase family protein [Spirosoma utsteinense]|uniref:Dienelactone hydrolase n=1 Tax=Spirosoma utsteinense TaxID=2585773 RepID=A0ABR6W459_9BACT|nr:dienelactone hydrolase [Spirosoma utsteinense]MBC3787060.1 putative dienelactone hydrolase [Spirosoma utsteinense]MBC3791391.1 putative dienelactone hydrolase [Spirosoma utsteinense]
MKPHVLFTSLLCSVVLTATSPLSAQNQLAKPSFVFGDLLPDAPELAARGSSGVGVRTLKLIHAGQVDVLHPKDGKAPLYDRTLTVEVWYPARIPAGKAELVTYDEVMGSANDPKRPLIPFTFQGRALRDADPDPGTGKYPLVIVSHGYLGSRLMFSYLTENLASKGYVVVSIDHAESTYRDAAGFPSTLLNRATDDLFVLNEVAKRSEKGTGSFLSGLLDANNTALVGYSMGGYGVLNAAGAGYSPQAVKLFGQMTSGSTALQTRSTGAPELTASQDPRVKAVVAFAPWGMERGVWDADGLAGLKLPTLFIAGSKDDISGYEKGIKAIYDGAVNADRYMLTYLNARHNVAPNPPPVESLQPGLPLDEYMRYSEPAWNERRINNINQHFVTAFLGMQLKKMDYGKYFDLKENDAAGPWTGFKPRTSVGLEMRHAKP